MLTVRNWLYYVCIVLITLLYGCGANSNNSDTQTSTRQIRSQSSANELQGPVVSDIFIQFSQDFQSRPKQRILELLTMVAGDQLQVLAEGQVKADQPGRYILLGDAALAKAHWPAWQAKPESEAYFVKTQTLDQSTYLYWAAGYPATDKALLSDTNIGDLYGAYHLLESLGFSFLHPLEPTLPPTLQWADIQETYQSPRWPIRAWHLHTQHPIELTHVLNGWGPEGPTDVEGWRSLLPEWDLFLEWAIANKQNRVEWFLLMAESWQTFADSSERQARLQELVDMSHQWSLAAGIDAPIAFKQQHAWTMLRDRGNEIAQIQSAIDWLNQAGFDYFEIEAGFSEFTHPTDFQMIEWMNEVARYSDEIYGKPAYVKVHCTQSQYAKSFLDPESGEPLNFNFLPYYADSRMGVLPHTVQYYDLEGPAFTYDNESFAFIRRYMQLEAGRREVLYYPETAYWVSFDIDVPLFLPIYMDRRLYDLRLIAADEDSGAMGRGDFSGSKIQGQVNFSSGWEWGYWMNDVVTARAAWNPMTRAENHDAAMAQALNPIVKPFGEVAEAIKQNLLHWIDVQNRLFIHGEVDGVDVETPYLRTAQAYLQGWEAWDDVNKTIGMLETQPRKMGMLDMLNPLAPKKNKIHYEAELKPLLHTTVTELSALFSEFQKTESQVPASSLKLYEEIKDSMEITLRRAQQVFHLYETAANIDPIFLNADKTEANYHLNKARNALDKAIEIVLQREPDYRVDADRIAGWNYNPTAYHFGYLWSVRSLHYWWRDEGKIVERPFSPGYMNIMDPVDVANGEGDWIEWIINLSSLREWIKDTFGSESALAELLYEPESEPQYPQNNLRERPEWYIPLD